MSTHTTTNLCACGAPRHNGAKCKDCYNTYMRNYMAKRRKYDEGAYRNNYLLKKYGITADQYEAMLSDQNGRCAICGTDQPGQTKWFEVDHDHACCPKKGSCGACVRGLLCTGCNSGISRFQDDPDRMEAAAAYVRARVYARVPPT
jgi:recombination endonuclease VII